MRFERFGPRIFLVRRNLDFRASRDTVEERTVEESFASSVLASFPILAEEGGRILIDASDFVLQDVFNVRGNLQRGQEGSFRLDRNRSAIYPSRTKAFPKNTEVEVLLTFESDAPGPEVARHTPDARALTLRQHHSFVELPDDNYKPRAFDPRVGIFSVDFYDFSLPFNRRPQVRWLSRWRLEKKNPGAALSDPVKPLVYYLDRGIPEPYRTAFKQGASWWNKTFEAAGFTNAFRVEDLPDSSRSDGCALLRDSVGASQRSRILRRPIVCRSADRRDHQGRAEDGYLQIDHRLQHLRRTRAGDGRRD